MSIKDSSRMTNKNMNSGPMLNSYPDSFGGTLSDIVAVLQRPELKDVFQSFYILPSVFNTDLDRGFSVIDYELNKRYASPDDLDQLKKMGIVLKFDLVLNHLSVLSKQFQDILRNGEKSKYEEFFINWNKFWEGSGKMTEDGYIQPHADLIKNMYFRKPGLPLLSVRMPDGKEVPYWNTFYQEVKYDKVDVLDLVMKMDIQYTSALKLADIINKALKKGIKPRDIDFGQYSIYRDKIIEFLESGRKYLGQIDLNIKSPMVWEFYEETLKKLAQYGARIIRLDAFAYTSKEPGAKNFFNEPETWDVLARIKRLADKYGLEVIPEIHSRYEDKIHEKLAERGYMTYDFFFPGLVIDALERNTHEYLIKWIKEIQKKDIKTINMLGCHDGIPLLDLKGLLPDRYIERLIRTIVERGGYVKELHGKKDIYYQVNATFYSALGENDKKLLLARAIQMFMPGRPQVWYLDLFAGKNDYQAVKRAGPGGHKEINRTNLSKASVLEGLKRDIVSAQLYLLRFRNTFPAFGDDSELTVYHTTSNLLKLSWQKNGCMAQLEANLEDYSFSMIGIDDKGDVAYRFTS